MSYMYIITITTVSINIQKSKVTSSYAVYTGKYLVSIT